MLTRRAVATPRTGGPHEVIAAVLDQIREASAQHRATVAAVGVSALGTVDPRAGIIRSAPTLPGFDNVPLGPRLHDALQLPALRGADHRPVQGSGCCECIVLSLRRT